MTISLAFLGRRSPAAPALELNDCVGQLYVMNDEIYQCFAGDSKAPALERTGASPEAIISHYDKGEDFFKLVLGPELI